MPTYIEKVKAEAQKQQAERSQKKQAVESARSDEYRSTMRPLNNRLADLLATIPDEIKRNGLSLSEWASNYSVTMHGVSSDRDFNLVARRAIACAIAPGLIAQLLELIQHMER
jgi:hypothetical protein